jgi:gas vesicle protein
MSSGDGWDFLRHVLWDVTWPSVIAWTECVIIAFAAAWLFRDRIGKKIAKWWKTSASPAISEEVHERISDLRTLVEQMNDHIHNGFLDEVHEKIDRLIAEKATEIEEAVTELEAGPVLIPVEQEVPDEYQDPCN